ILRELHPGRLLDIEVQLLLEMFVHHVDHPVANFFFQAEDGIRDRNVTGVQTCALPISSYVSGTHMWKGNAAILNAKPANAARRPSASSGSVAAEARATVARLVERTAP